MKECATCKHFKYIYKGTHPNYAGCEKFSMSIFRDRYRCSNYKKRYVMNWKSWKFWAVIAAVVLAIVATVLYFTVPAFKDVLITFFVGVAGFTIGILIGKCFGLDKNGR